MTDNVVPFPKQTPKRAARALPEETKETLDKNKAIYLDSAANQISVALLNSLAVCGIDIFDPEFGKDFNVTTEFIRSTMYRNCHIIHPLQDLMSDITENRAIYFGEEDEVAEFLTYEDIDNDPDFF
ncbi:MAG: hypothetical protein HN684_00890 [Euryarchaeota archaeon]|jgi:hypothetical protein|nr:hypothetical protein [Euryarchaeota archaeon]